MPLRSLESEELMLEGRKQKLSERLQKIEAMANLDYDHIWDCCCDHGLLGASLLSNSTSPTIHFVDSVPAIMSALEEKLHTFFPGSSRWNTHCLDAAKIPILEYPGRHLVIIAGVGGDLTGKIAGELKAKETHHPVDYLLCPVHHQYELREELRRLEFSLLDEILVEENNRFYEILSLSSLAGVGTPIGEVGEKLWRDDAGNARAYLERKLKHYRKASRGGDEKSIKALRAYGRVKDGINSP